MEHEPCGKSAALRAVGLHRRHHSQIAGLVQVVKFHAPGVAAELQGGHDLHGFSFHKAVYLFPQLQRAPLVTLPDGNG